MYIRVHKQNAAFTGCRSPRKPVITGKCAAGVHQDVHGNSSTVQASRVGEVVLGHVSSLASDMLPDSEGMVVTQCQVSDARQLVRRRRVPSPVRRACSGGKRFSFTDIH